MLKRAVALVLILGLLVTCSAHAAKVAVEWTNPSTNTDGSALTNLASVTLVWGACSSTGDIVQPYQATEKVITTIPGAKITGFVYPTALPTACIAAYATNSSGGNSVLSNVAVAHPIATLGQPAAIAAIVHLEISHHVQARPPERHRRPRAIARAGRRRAPHRLLRVQGLHAELLAGGADRRG